MKSIIILVIIVLTTSKYTLKIYEPPDCNYCKFAASQIEKLVQENHWYQTLNVVIIDCQHDSHQCRDLMNKPLIALYEGDRKIKEVGGVRSKFYFRDWIAEVVQENIVEIEEVSSTPGDKYRRIRVKNKEDVVAFYWNQVDRLAKVQKDKPDILAQAFSNKVSEKSGQQGIIQTSLEPTSREQQPNGNFEGELRKLIMMGSPILLVAMLVAVLKATICRKRKQNESIQISSQED